jgi:ABC-2 type transport system ATP-binding protein
MTALIGTQGLGKRYRRLRVLADGTLSVPGLVGPNGAGKTTLLSLAPGLLEPARSMSEVLGGPPPASPARLARAGFAAGDASVYGGLPVAGQLPLGAHLNPRWDEELARDRAGRLDLNPGQLDLNPGRLDLNPGRKVRTLSGGQRAQPALTLAIAKRPRAADPRRTGGQPGSAGPAGVPAGPAGGQRRAGPVGGAVLSPDRRSGTGPRLPRRAGRLAGAGRRTGRGAAGHPSPAGHPSRAVRAAPRPPTPPAGQQVISASHTDQRTTPLGRSSGPVLDPAWTVSEVGLEDLVLASKRQASPDRRSHDLAVDGR